MIPGRMMAIGLVPVILSRSIFTSAVTNGDNAAFLLASAISASCNVLKPAITSVVALNALTMASCESLLRK